MVLHDPRRRRQDLRPLHRVYASQRLVQDIKVGVPGQKQAQVQPLRLPFGEPGHRLPLGQIPRHRPEPIQVQAREEVPVPFDSLPHRQLPGQQGAVSHIGHLRPLPPSDRPSVEQDLPAVGPPQPGDGPQQGGLPRPVGTQQAGDVPRCQGEAARPQHDLSVQMLTEPFDFQQTVHRLPPPRSAARRPPAGKSPAPPCPSGRPPPESGPSPPGGRRAVPSPR